MRLSLKRLGALSAAELQHYTHRFHQNGHVVIPSLFKAEELLPVQRAVEETVDEVAAELKEAGKIADTCAGADFFTRLTLLEQQWAGAAVLVHTRGVLPLAVAELWSDERLLQLARCVLGTGDVGLHPVWNLRSKTPGSALFDVPWHQDSAYLLDNGNERTLQMTAWIPLLDVSRENGAMEVMPGMHDPPRVYRHKVDRSVPGSWYLVLDDERFEEDARDVETALLEVPLGGVALLGNVIPHRSLANTSQKVRWSLDLRFQDAKKVSGLEGIKEVAIAGRATDPSFRIDWTTPQMQEWRGMRRIATSDPFDTTVHGPWIERWQ